MPAANTPANRSSDRRAHPEALQVYAWGIVTMWLGLAGTLIAAISLARAESFVALSGMQMAVGIGGDLAIACLTGWWLYHPARAWHGERRAIGGIMVALLPRAALFTGLCTVVLSLVWWAGAATPSTDGLWQWHANRWPAQILLDHLLFWMAAASTVPLPWLIFNRVESDAVQQPDTILIRSHGRIDAVAVASIDRVRSVGNYLELYCAGRVVLHRITLGHFLSQIGGGRFLRISRGQAVRLASVTRLAGTAEAGYMLETVTGESLPISRRFRSSVLLALADRSSHQAAQQSPTA